MPVLPKNAIISRNIHMKIRSRTAALAFVFLTISVSLLGGSETEASVLPSFRDVAANTTDGEATGWLAKFDILKGYPDGSFQGSRLVGRHEAAKILMRAAKKPLMVYFNRGRFEDVEDGQWYTPFVLSAEQENIVEGFDDGRFDPTGDIKTAEFLKMISLTFELPTNLPHQYADVDESQWYAKYAGAAARYNLFPERGFSLEPERPVTRMEVAVAVFNVLKNSEGRPTINGGEWPITPSESVTVVQETPNDLDFALDIENGGPGELDLDELLHSAAEKEQNPLPVFPAEGDGVTPGTIRTTRTQGSRICPNETQCFAPFGCRYINQTFDAQRCLTGCGILDCSGDPTRPKAASSKPVEYEKDPTGRCPSVACTDVPPGCKYENVEFDANGCKAKCGSLVCKQKFQMSAKLSAPATYNNKGALSYVIELENVGVEPLFEIDIQQLNPPDFTFHFPGSSPICMYHPDDNLVRCTGLGLFPGQTAKVVVSYTPNVPQCANILESTMMVYAESMTPLTTKTVLTELKCEGASSSAQSSTAESSAQSSEAQSSQQSSEAQSSSEGAESSEGQSSSGGSQSSEPEDPVADVSVTASKSYCTSGCYNFAWTYTVKNDGPNKANNVILETYPPEGLVYEPLNTTNCKTLQTAGGRTFERCTRPDLNRNGIWTPTWEYAVAPTTACGVPMTFSTFVMTNTLDPNIQNNITEWQMTIPCPEPAPDLAATFEAWPDMELVPDELVSFLVHATNTGDPAQNAVLELNLWEQNISRIFEFVPEESDPRCTYQPPATVETPYTKVGQDFVRCSVSSFQTNAHEYFTVVFRVKNAQCDANRENFVQAGMTSSKTDKDVGDNYDFISFSDFPGCSRQPGSLYVKSGGATTAELQLGARGHSILSMDLDNDFDSIGVGGFIFLTVDNEALTVEELHVMYGNNVIAVARPDTCGGLSVKSLNGKPTRAFCGVTGEDLFTVPRGMSRRLEVKPVMIDASHGISGGTVQLTVLPEVHFDGQTNPFPGVIAVRKVNNALLLKNNVDGEANGELIFGVNASEADLPILGSKNPVQTLNPFSSSLLNWVGSMFRR